MKNFKLDMATGAWLPRRVKSIIRRANPRWDEGKAALQNAHLGRASSWLERQTV